MEFEYEELGIPFVKVFLSNFVLSLITRALFGFEVAIIFSVCWGIGLLVFFLALLAKVITLKKEETK